ncbi:hypothetical protein Cantr_06376 [Candida viswanathii]|uniref:DNA damage-binding protein 1 n=1 Tax=Candida viswanathii TaxID=5486 RepID=A0A367XY31_9ASCO|nr:hypothetical protein Cantr_06376 [Candida viswanathii]
MLILSELSSQGSVHDSGIIRPNNDLSCLVLLVGSRHAFDLYRIHTNELEFLETIAMTNKVLSFATATIDSQDTIIFLDDLFHIGLIIVDKDLSVTIEIITKLSTKGQVQAFEYPPTIVSNKPNNPTFIAFHVFHSTIQVLYLRNPVTIDEILSKSNPKKRKHGSFDTWWSIHSVPIGRIIVKQLISLDAPENTLAILYKDISSTFYVRYLEVNGAQKSATMSRQFPEFQEEPLLIVPVAIGGHIALTRSAIFYFPELQIKNLTISKALKGVTTSGKLSQPYFVKSLVGPNSRIDVQDYVSYTVIDKNRILVVSESGNSNMIYIDLEASSTITIIVNEVAMLSLGDVTIPNPNGLLHITGDLFFQGSRLSRSVLFLVLSDLPHIHIRAFISGSPPELDISAGPHEIYTSQGGWSGSEIRKYTSNPCVLEVLETAELGFRPAKLRIAGDVIVASDPSGGNKVLTTTDLKPFEGNREFAEDLLLYVRDHINGDDLEITQKDLDPNSLGDVAESSSQARYVRDMKTVLTYSKAKDICLSNSDGTITFQRADKFVPSSMDGVKIADDECLVLVASWSDRFEIWSYKTGGVHLVYEGVLEGDSSITGSAITWDDSNGSITVILLTANLWLQLNFVRDVSGMLEIDNSLSRDFYGDPVSIRKWKSNVVLFSTTGLAPLKRDILLNFYVPTSIARKDIEDVAMTLDNTLVAIYKSGLIEKLQFGIEPLVMLTNHQSLFSRELFIKVMYLGESDYVIGVLHNKLSDETITSELHLIETTAYETIYVFKFDEGIHVLDICDFDASPIFSESSGVYFVCLTTLEDAPLPVFNVKDQEIVELAPGAITEADLPLELKLNSLTLFDEDGPVFLCSGDCALLLELDDDLEWKVVPYGDIHCSTFTLAQAVLFDDIYLVDAINGLFQMQITDVMSIREPMECRKVRIDGYAANQMTAIATFSKSGYSYIITGDASGTIVVIKSKTADPIEKKFIKFNVGDQVNVITRLGKEKLLVTQICAIGTLLGGLYVLSETNDGDGMTTCSHELQLYGEIKGLPSLDFTERSSESILEKERIACDSVINGKALAGVLKELVVHPETMAESHPVLHANRHLLQKIHVETNTIE